VIGASLGTLPQFTCR